MNRVVDKLVYVFYGVVLVVAVGVGLYFYNKQYSFNIVEKEITMMVGDKYSIQVYAATGYFNADNYTISLSNDNLSNEKFTFTALKEGTTDIKIKSKKGYNVKKIKVTTINSKVETLETEEKVISSIDDTKKINVTINNDEKIKTNLKYESLNPDVAEVDDKGNVTGVSTGTATIKIIYSDDVYTYTDVEIVKDKVELKDITVPSEINLKPGEEQKISITYDPENSTDKETTYSVDNEKVAKVVNGKVVALKDGKTTITVTAGKIKKKIKVVVKSPVTPTPKPTSTSIPIETAEPTPKPTATSTPKPTAAPVQTKKIDLIRGSMYNNGFLHFTEVPGTNGSVPDGALVQPNCTPGYTCYEYNTVINANKKNNCDNTDDIYKPQTYTLYPANNDPIFQECHYEGTTKVYTAEVNGSNDKLVKVTPDDEVQLDILTYGKTYSPDGNTWPHLLITGRSGTNGLGGTFTDHNLDVVGLKPSDKSFYYFTNDNDIHLSLDVKLNSYNQGQKINGIHAFQFLLFLEVYCDKACGNEQAKYWFGFNLFDDRGVCLEADQGDVRRDDKTKWLTVLLPSKTIYTNGTIYNDGNFVYNEWKHVDIDVSQRINELVYQINTKGGYPNVKASDLRYGGFNIGYEVHGEYWTSMSFKNLSLTSTKK